MGQLQLDDEHYRRYYALWQQAAAKLRAQGLVFECLHSDPPELKKAVNRTYHMLKALAQYFYAGQADRSKSDYLRGLCYRELAFHDFVDLPWRQLVDEFLPGSIESIAERKAELAHLAPSADGKNWQSSVAAICAHYLETVFAIQEHLERYWDYLPTETEELVIQIIADLAMTEDLEDSRRLDLANQALLLTEHRDHPAWREVIELFIAPRSRP